MTVLQELQLAHVNITAVTLKLSKIILEIKCIHVYYCVNVAVIVQWLLSGRTL